MSALDLPPRLRVRVISAATGWMDWLCPLIDEAMLVEIAAADYGYREAEHLATLRTVRDGQRIDGPALWSASEVLELIRWSQPDDPAWAPGGHGRRGHLMRLFCCALLLTLASDAALRPYFEEELQLRPLVGSALVLGDEAIDAMLPLVCFRIPDIPADAPERPFFGLAALLLAAARYRAEGDGPLLAELCPWLIAAEATARAAQAPALLRPPWLLGLEMAAAGDDAWRELAWRVLVDPPVPHPPAAATALAAIGARLVLGDASGEGR